MDNGPSVLVADDDCQALNLLVEYLQGAGYQAVPVRNGEEAWALMADPNYRFSAFILDRKMPYLGGMELLQRLAANSRLGAIPVIFQTGLCNETDIAEGIHAGVFYYLTKPFVKEILLSVVQSAVRSFARYQVLKAEAEGNANAMKMMASGRFVFRTMGEARALAGYLASACPDPKRAVTGLCELMFNSVEHGNLGIGFDEKSVLLREGRLESEIERRLELPEYRARSVTVDFSRNTQELSILIRDQGHGFDPRPFLEIDPKRATAPHGRGIAMARMLGLSNLDYQGRGNEVLVQIRLNQMD